MTNRQTGRASKKSSSGEWHAHAAILAVIVVSMLASGFVWLLPLEVAQQWALNRAGNGSFDRFEAIGEAEFSLWLSRTTSIVVTIFICCIWYDLDRWRKWCSAFFRGLLVSTTPNSTAITSNDRSIAFQIRTVGCRVVLIAWLVLFASQAIQGIRQRIHEWPYFRFNSGNTVLPNISDSNRAVIRYLEKETPRTARILVASDQKLFFLSYYLRPRLLWHRMHPDSEHVIPLKEQQRKLNAYRLDELTDRDLEHMPHDYTLEYFEHPDMVNRALVLDDSKWLSFIRQREHNPSLIPQYVVRLRSTGEANK